MAPRGLDPALTEPHLNNSSTFETLREFERTLGAAQVDAAIEEAGLTRDYLDDLSRWSSVTFQVRLADALAAAAGLAAVPPYDHPFWQHWRRASWQIAEAGVGSLFWLQIWAMERPSAFFAAIESLYQTNNLLTRVRLLDQGPGWSSVEVEESLAFDTRPAACWSRRGYFETIPQVWALPRGAIDHPRCRHRDPGVATGVYVIRYDEAVAPPPEAALRHIASLLRQNLAVAVARQQRSFREFRAALLAQRKIASYLPSTALRAIELDPERELGLGGQRGDGAVLFADIVDFTRRFVDADAEDVVDHLNLYFELMDEVIAAHGGIIDKRMGDAIMVVFVAVEAPRRLAELAALAVGCGLEMLRRLPACNAARAERGGDALAIRVGVAAGSLIQGNLGSSRRMEYTVIGEPVNLAARLQSAARSGCVLTSPACLDEAPELAAAVRRRIVAKGIGEVDVLEIDPSTAP